MTNASTELLQDQIRVLLALTECVSDKHPIVLFFRELLQRLPNYTDEDGVVKCRASYIPLPYADAIQNAIGALHVVSWITIKPTFGERSYTEVRSQIRL